MSHPEHFFRNSIPWDSWVTTERAPRSYEMEIGCDGYVSRPNKKKLDEKHPGFTFAYETLSYLGCDSYFVTDLLKFCLVHAKGMPLDTFLLDSNILPMIRVAVDLAMPIDELAPLLIDAVHIEQKAELPDGINLTA